METFFFFFFFLSLSLPSLSPNTDPFTLQ